MDENTMDKIVSWTIVNTSLHHTLKKKLFMTVTTITIHTADITTQITINVGIRFEAIETTKQCLSSTISYCSILTVVQHGLLYVTLQSLSIILYWYCM